MRISDWSSDVCSSDLAYRRAQLWRDIKNRIHELVDGKQLTPLWIIDEAQNLPPEFFRDFPAFLNFAFDARDLITVWLVGHPSLAQTLERAPYAALHSRIQVQVKLKPVVEPRTPRLRPSRTIPPACRASRNLGGRPAVKDPSFRLRPRMPTRGDDGMTPH